jgi:GcrA cell cycle regulator
MGIIGRPVAAKSGPRRVRFETFKLGKKSRMQSTDWPSEHSEALREYHARGMSYLQIAKAINANFNTRYSRNAVLGRSRRMGLGSPDGPADSPEPASVDWSSAKPEARVPYLGKPHERHAAAFILLAPKFEAAKPVKLRCVAIVPRHLSLIDLEPGDCRYPYGGDEEGEAITYCGHPRRKNSSYCGAHFRLTRGRGTKAERAACKVLLRFLDAA